MRAWSKTPKGRACGRRFYLKNKDKIMESARKWKKKNPGYAKWWYYENKAYFPKYYQENKERIKKIRAPYLLKTKEKRRNKQVEYYHKNIEKMRKISLFHSKKSEYKRKRNERNKKINRENPKARINNAFHVAVYSSLKGIKRGRAWKKLVGYTLQDLIKHLEKQFTKGMSWKNYGKYWHVDHTLPISYFKFDSYDDIEFKKCWCLSNLRPLEAKENIIKGNKIVGQIPILFY